MTAAKVSERQPSVQYDRRTAQYRNSQTGRFVPRATILRLVDDQSDHLSTRMKALARLLSDGKIELGEFQRRASDDIKLSSIRMGVFASGGRSQTPQSVYGVIGRELRSQYSFLANFAQDLAAGKLTKEQAIARAALYGGASRTAFHQAEKVARKREGFVEAKRSLDPQSRHCISCLGYSTNGEWLPVEQVTMPTVNCQCMSRCRCQVVFRRRASG